MKYNISNLIKTYRKKKGITQSELARGICTQAIISKIENSETTPSMEIFFCFVKGWKYQLMRY